VGNSDVLVEAGIETRCIEMGMSSVARGECKDKMQSKSFEMYGSNAKKCNSVNRKEKQVQTRKGKIGRNRKWNLRNTI
jgi:hypothetical protein